MRAALIAAALTLAGGPARGAAPEPEAMTLGQALSEALTRNPEIAAARKSFEAADARVGAARTWPDPQVGVEYWGFPGSSVSLGAAPERWYDVSQTIPFPGKLGLKGRAQEHSARREGAQYAGTRLDVLARVKQAYVALMAAEKVQRLFMENVEMVRKFAKAAESKYAVGKAPQSDALRAQVELSKMLNRLLNVQQERETAQARLNMLLDRRPGEPIRAVEEPSPAPLPGDYAVFEKLALENRPELHAAAHHVEHMGAELKSAKADFLPDFMTQYTWRTMSGRPTDSIAMLKINVPLWFWRQGAVVKSVRREGEHAGAMLRSMKAMTRYEVKEFLVHVETSRRLLELYRTTILPQAEQSLSVSEAAYQSDRVDFLALLDAERALLEFRLEYVRALAEYGTNLAHLERVVGVDLAAKGGS